MAVTIPDDMRAVMRDGSHRARMVADVFYDGRPVLSGLSLSKTGQLSGTASSRVQTTGRLLIASGAQMFDGQGNSIAPQTATDALAPYGQEVVVSRQVFLGTELIGAQSLGRFRITNVPSIAKTARRLRQRYGTDRILDSVLVELEVSDQLDRIDQANFTRLEAPLGGASTWSEVRRLSPIPVVQSIADRQISANLVYESSRLDTLGDLLMNVGAVPHITRSGAFSARLAVPSASPTNYAVDLTGTIQVLAAGMTGSFYNVVKVTGNVQGTQQILAVARLESGPLRWNGPAGERVYERSAGLSDSAAAAQLLADAVLRSQLRNRTRTVSITCLPNVEVELGDPARAADPVTGRVEYGMVSRIEWPMNPTALMQVELETDVIV